MPLRAVIDGKDCIAPLVTDAEWEQVRKISRSRKSMIVLPCCGSRGHARVSKLGTRHFYHKPHADCHNWEPETVHHLKAKTDILLACRDAGYEALTEAAENDWRADVLAWKEKQRIAFEVQWSYQTLIITKERQERYAADGVRGCWFCKKLPARYNTPTSELPLFSLFAGGKGILFVALNGRSYALREFTSALLANRVKFCREMRLKSKQKVRVAFGTYDCWKCGQVSNIYRVAGEYQSICGLPIPGDAQDKTFHPEIVSAVQRFLNTREGRQFRLGRIKKRFSGTAERSYMSFGCSWCDALFGNRYLAAERGCHDGPAYEIEVTLPEGITNEGAHWCVAEDGAFCE